LRARSGLRYRHPVHAFEFDMAFAPHEIAAGLERLFAKLGIAAVSHHPSSTRYEYDLTLDAGHAARLVVRPLPAERRTYPTVFPRTLVEAEADAGVDLAALRRQVLCAFLRVMG